MRGFAQEHVLKSSWKNWVAEHNKFSLDIVNGATLYNVVRLICGSSLLWSVDARVKIIYIICGHLQLILF